MTNKVNACYLYSKANYPITIKYDGQDLILPPNASKFKLANENKVGVLPKTVRKVTIREDK
jgi:hypothetical protein